MKFMVPRNAMRYAKRLHPSINQRFKSIYDPIVPIHLGEFQPELIEQPTVYFALRQDDKFVYALYCFFHRKDWSEWIWPVRALDEHEYDFEGVLLIWGPNSRFGSPEAGISVFHNNFKYRTNPTTFKGKALVEIEPGGHGVYFPEVIRDDNKIQYENCKLVNMANKSTLKWLKDEVQPVFNSTNVKMPWQWNDENLVTHFGREQTEGLMWRNPSLLYRLAKKAKLL